MFDVNFKLNLQYYTPIKSHLIFLYLSHTLKRSFERVSLIPTKQDFIPENESGLHILSSILFMMKWRQQTYQGLTTSQIDSWGIIITLSENNFVEELFYVFPRNAFPRNNFPRNVGEARKQMMRTNQVSSWLLIIFVGRIWTTKSHLISQRTF